jgi:hypothetical protein|tara:strand:+ start:1646 stop:2104 length:459 start_codon:yes stop_codon:yes gene_type:complete
MITLLEIPPSLISPMTKQQSDEFRDCHRCELRFNKTFKIDNVPISLRNNPVIRILQDRLVGWAGAEISVAVAVFIAKSFSDFPVIWAYTLAQIYHNRGQMITMNDLAEHFPFGLPDAQGMQYARHIGGEELNNPKNWKTMEELSIFGYPVKM